MHEFGERQKPLIEAIRLNKSMAFELQRLCAPEIAVRQTVDERAAGSDDCIASVHLAGVTGRPSAIVRELQFECFVRISTRESPGTGDSPKVSIVFDLSAPTERLALLSQIAEYIARSSMTRVTPYEFSRPLYRYVAQIQSILNLGTTEAGLSRRLGVDPSTVRRWFKRVGTVNPKRFMRWVQLHAVVSRCETFGDTVEAATRVLGFDQANAVRSDLRKLAGVSAIELRDGEGMRKFQRQMRIALSRYRVERLAFPVKLTRFHALSGSRAQRVTEQTSNRNDQGTR